MVTKETKEWCFNVKKIKKKNFFNFHFVNFKNDFVKNTHILFGFVNRAKIRPHNGP